MVRQHGGGESMKNAASARNWSLVVLAVAAGFCVSSWGQSIPNNLPLPDASGWLSTYSIAGSIDLTNPFFQNLGTNGRTCGTCHAPAEAWSITPQDVKIRFLLTAGTEPIFRTVDGANCPSADVATLQARKTAYSQLLSKGLIRISLPVPGNAQFAIVNVRDPYNCPETTTTQPAMYRRPLPATNLPFLSAVMWDGRETVFGALPGKSLDLTQSLSNQATDATLGHAQASMPPSSTQIAQILAFETAMSTAQISDNRAGLLTSAGATGGAVNLSAQPFYIGINDALGGDPNGNAFNPSAFNLYSNWRNLTGADRVTLSRQSVARGQALFNIFPIPITGVGGLNDALNQPVIMGTCTTCHDTPNVGNHSFSVPLAIGTTGYPAVPALDIAGLPVYTIQCTNGTQVQVTDPGRALISGKCADIGKVKGPILRGLAARAPYFHNGAATNLGVVVDFYNQRFNLNLTTRQKADLVAFLQTL
jgi:cytochrome c peroxidase